MTFKDCIEKYVKEGYIGTNNTCNGKCSKCGECCGIVLPIDQDDANKIQQYVIKHKIFPQRYLAIMRNKLQCPYYTGKKEGCSIYEARPKICKYFTCNRKSMTPKELETMKDVIPVDMWTFAETIEKDMKKYGINKTNGKKIK